jgi:chromosome segregation ATPase
MSQEFAASMADVINQYTYNHKAELEHQKTKYHKYIKRLKRQLENCEGVVAHRVSQIQAQNEEIDALRQDAEQLTSQLKDTEAKLAKSESRVLRMEDKYQKYKTHLNAAIKEQQDLYLRSKERFANTMKEMQELNAAQTAEAEMAVQKAEAIRQEMSEKLQQTIEQNKAEVAEREWPTSCDY